MTNGGLNNRLRVVLSYLYKANKEDRKLKIIWIKDAACYEDFENLFQDIDNVYISKNDDEFVDYDTWNIENEEYVKNKYKKLLFYNLIIWNKLLDYCQMHQSYQS
jgi:hypothetical protein